MCGRFVSSTPISKLVEQFLVEEVKVDAEGHDPSYNVAPTNDILAVAASSEGVRRLGTFRWGLVPSWAKDPATGNRMINLRASTVSEKPAFKRMLAKHRCIIPVDGFYEWKDMGKGRKKQPFYIRSRDGSVLALAGLWGAWKDKDAAGDADDDWLRTCTIITTEPNKVLKPVHDRMPVVLPPEAWDTWLDRSNEDAAAMAKLLRPAPDDLLELYPVSTEVNKVGNDGEQLVVPLEGHEADETD